VAPRSFWKQWTSAVISAAGMVASVTPSAPSSPSAGTATAGGATASMLSETIAKPRRLHERAAE